MLNILLATSTKANAIETLSAVVLVLVAIVLIIASVVIMTQSNDSTQETSMTGQVNDSTEEVASAETTEKSVQAIETSTETTSEEAVSTTEVDDTVLAAPDVKAETSLEKSEKIVPTKHWYNNGTINVLTESCPEGFVKGRLKK